MRDGELFEIADTSFYEHASNYEEDPEYRELVLELIGDEGDLFRGDIWLYSILQPDDVTEGLKIHLSTIPADAKRLLNAVVPICIESVANFKFAADGYILGLINSKSYNRGYSGKFITIYPRTRGEFIRLIEQIYEGLKPLNLRGPYILSDSRYRDSGVLYWRYGGFLSPTRTNLDGSKTPMLRSPDGELVSDERTPYFILPEWVPNPFEPRSARQERHDDESIFLSGRYEIKERKSSSNAGGVYRAYDHELKRDVVVKEARPFVNSWELGKDHWDATSFLAHEHRVLSILEDLDFVPKAVDFFVEWEHHYLVQSVCPGITLGEFWSKQDALPAPHIRNAATLKSFPRRFGAMTLQLLDMVERVHARRVIVGDLSPYNILVDETTEIASLIDFESAVMIDSDEPEFRRYSARWGTPGFKSPERTVRENVVPADDFYSLAMSMLFAIVPINTFLTLKPDAERDCMKHLVRMGLPVECSIIIECLKRGDPPGAREAASRLVASGRRRRSSSFRLASEADESEPLDDERIGRSVSDIASYIDSTTSLERNDRLWPAHFAVFTTNPMSIAFGASGVALFLREARGTVPTGVKHWMKRLSASAETLPPSLFAGSAGVAYAFSDMGLQGCADDTLRKARESPLCFKSPNMFHGAAGWGMASLFMYSRTRDEAHLRTALSAVDFILTTASHTDEGHCWPEDETGRVHYGYGFGSSGIALFLINAALVTDDTTILTAASAAMEYDLAAREIGAETGSRWKRFEGDSMHYPFWIQGSAGICSVLVRFGALTGNSRYLELAKEIGNEIYVKYAFSPGLFEGLAGIGECMLDLYLFSGDESFHHKARDIAETLLWFELKRPEGAAYPGRWLTRISTDYGTGSSGIGLFLSRVSKPGRRHLMDLDTAPVNHCVEGKDC